MNKTGNQGQSQRIRPEVPEQLSGQLPVKLSDFDFELPESLIAQHPLAERSQSRLLEVPAAGPLCDRLFGQLPGLLAPGDLLVMNDTRVIRARLHGERTITGGRIELLVERVLDAHRVLALVRASHPPPPHTRIRFGAGAHRTEATVLEREDNFYRVEFDDPVDTVLERLGEMPLPPYIGAQAGRNDEERYQTVYARVPGAVAAPTAGLHFDEALLAAIRARGVALATLTLHVGAGTFQPVRHEQLSEHRMHAERFEIPQATAEAIARTRAAGGRVIAVGTTTLRALESTGGEPGKDETRLFIVPGFRFRVVDRLITNFHLPRSTLIMLVSAFAGVDRIREAYRHAIAARYRFFSYGDAMLLDRTS